MTDKHVGGGEEMAGNLGRELRRSRGGCLWGKGSAAKRICVVGEAGLNRSDSAIHGRGGMGSRVRLLE